MLAQSTTPLIQACVSLALVLAVANTVAAGRPASHVPPSDPNNSDQTITLYTTGAAPPFSRHHPVFTSEGSISHSGSWLRALTRPGTLRPATVTVVDEQVHGRKEFGLPMEGRLQGVLVTSLADNSSRMVAVKASFAGDGAGDSIRFFGVHRDDQKESHIAVVGGTGRYHHAAGFAVVRAAVVPETSGNVRMSRAFSFSVHLKY
ncbi:hypothetical protein PR202_gb04284 [Eleusine coracana subsp. coracana]|uniref:Dirigent protein n=1 Tax=Eleusine coracana subsp. coracana TaxID=191504 RepID=A0AAV5E1R1_ELECO|nr:hypothetical protein QOZ80_1BG0089170 [Eleusine coracana subsp. coracana]GJN17233.1 hypothetical protein PR202_gb04284 [Eleusine coracana subsp. coracana]